MGPFGTPRLRRSFRSFDPWQVIGDVIKPIVGGTRPLRVAVSGEFIEFRDVAYGGTYVLHPDAFRHDTTGRPPHIVMRFQVLTNAKDEDERFYELPPEVIARVWNDFDRTS